MTICVKGCIKIDELLYSIPNDIPCDYLTKLASFRFAGYEIANGQDPNILLASARKAKNHIQEIYDGWSIEHECLSPLDVNRESQYNDPGVNFCRKDSFSSKTLYISIAQLISSVPAISPRMNNQTLSIIETKSKLHLLLLKKFKQNLEVKSQKWISRPFQYSSALNLDVAVAVLNILIKRRTPDLPLVFLDPVCGSGTTLYVARSLGIKTVIGRDIKKACVEGSKINLVHCEVFDEEYVKLSLQDSTHSINSGKSLDSLAPNICIANLPWGENTFEYYGENVNIIRCLGRELQSGCVCAFIVKEKDEKIILKHLNQSLFLVEENILIGSLTGIEGKNIDRGVKNRNKDTTTDCRIIFALKL